MKPEYVGVGNFDEEHYVYALCNCPVTEGWAIKFDKILDGKPHRYSCVCEDCGTKVGVYAKSYGPEYYKEEMNELISKQAVLDTITKVGLLKNETKEVQAISECLRKVEKLQPVKQETVTEFADRCRECGKMRTGHWITHEEQFNALGIAVKGGVKCSECGYTTHNKLHMEIGCPYKYCPNCGVKMIEPKDSEDVKCEAKMVEPQKGNKE